MSNRTPISSTLGAGRTARAPQRFLRKGSSGNETRFIPLDKLSVSKTNMRYAMKAPDMSDIPPTIRKCGVIQPLIVRPNCNESGFEIVGGTRRFHAVRIVAGESEATGSDTALLPCAILNEDEDADAIQASLIENIARFNPDEVTQW